MCKHNSSLQLEVPCRYPDKALFVIVTIHLCTGSQCGMWIPRAPPLPYGITNQRKRFGWANRVAHCGGNASAMRWTSQISSGVCTRKYFQMYFGSMPHPWRCWRPGWMGLRATRYGGRLEPKPFNTSVALCLGVGSWATYTPVSSASCQPALPEPQFCGLIVARSHIISCGAR